MLTIPFNTFLESPTNINISMGVFLSRENLYYGDHPRKILIVC